MCYYALPDPFHGFLFLSTVLIGRGVLKKGQFNTNIVGFLYENSFWLE